MTTPARIVDAHVHLWDPARTDWYPYLAGQQDIGMAVAGMARHFPVATYQSEMLGWNVQKLVNVAAATGDHSVDETLDMQARADADPTSQPAALIGGLPGTEAAGAIAAIERQVEAPRFRAVRPMGAPLGWVPPSDVLDALATRGLILEILARPEHLADAAASVAGHDDLTVVVEHTGWPATGSGEERAAWETGMQALAAVGPNLHCKLSGVVGATGAMSADALRPWIEPAIGWFGTDRCFFASNFPVDGLHGSLDQLWSAYAEVTEVLDEATVDALYATNAERLYRI